MRHLVFDPGKSGGKMNIVCFISGSGTNYREIVKRDPNHRYVVFTNRPGCSGLEIARNNDHDIIEVSHIPYLKDAVNKYGQGKVPRNCSERERYEQDICRLIEAKLGGQPDIVCLAGYDQWVTDWLVERYYPKMLNVHPGDTTQGYDGLHWIPSAKAIIAGDDGIRSTLFVVDKGEDTGPVLVQSAKLSIRDSLDRMEIDGRKGLLNPFHKVNIFIKENSVKTYGEFKTKAGADLAGMMEMICNNLQDALKITGDWKIYPFAVHDLIGKGRVAVEGRNVYIDWKKIPEHGLRLDEV
jgi:phosphoribosylglycinamide formyltransferase 1